MDFPSEKAAVNMYNIRAQLVSKLNSTGVLSDDVLSSIENVDSFKENWSGRVGLELVPISEELGPLILDEGMIHELWELNQDNAKLSNEQLIAQLKEQGHIFAGTEEGVLQQLDGLDVEQATMDAMFGDAGVPPGEVGFGPTGPDLPPTDEPIDEKAPEVGDTPEGPGGREDFHGPGADQPPDQPGLLKRD